MSIRIGLWACSLVAILAFGPHRAQAADPVPAKASGKIAAITADGIKVTSPLGSVIVIASQARLAEMFPDKGKVLSVVVSGDAETNFMGKGQGVTFNAELTATRTSKDEINTLTLFTPDATHRLEMTQTAPNLDDNGATSEQAGSYLVSGRIQSFRDGQLIVLAPNERGKEVSVRVRVADNAKVKVQMGDVSIARPGDAIEVEGHTYSPKDQPAALIVAESVKIVGAKPFVNPKKAKAQALATRTPPKPERKPRPTKNEPAEPEEVAVAPAAPAAPAAVAAQSAPGAPGKRPAVVRQLGDPPAEPIVVRDEFSVDEEPKAKEAPAAAPAKSRAR